MAHMLPAEEGASGTRSSSPANGAPGTLKGVLNHGENWNPGNRMFSLKAEKLGIQNNIQFAIWTIVQRLILCHFNYSGWSLELNGIS